MRLEDIKRKIWHKKEDKGVKRVFPITWWKLVIGIVLLCPGAFFGYLYLENVQVIFFGIGASVFIALSIFMVYQSFQAGESGFSFKGKRRYTGKENAIILFARRNGDEGEVKDVPVAIRFHELKPEHIPRGARLHYVRNLKKHYYELLYNTTTKKLEPVILPDKKSFPPELFKIPAAMQTYKDAIEYSPPTLLQKVAPGILLLAMGIVGILMVMTAPS